MLPKSHIDLYKLCIESEIVTDKRAKSYRQKEVNLDSKRLTSRKMVSFPAAIDSSS